MQGLIDKRRNLAIFVDAGSPELFIAVQNLVIFTEALLSLLIRVVSFVDALTFSRVR